MNDPETRFRIGIIQPAEEDEVPSIRRVVDGEELLRHPEIVDLIGVIRDKILWGVYGDYGELVKLTEIRDIERLDDSDENAAAFQKLYLKGLREEPSSFGSTYEIESKKTLEEVKAFLKDNHVVGAKYSYRTADGEQRDKLVAIAQYKRREGVQSHIAYLGKVYVHPAHRKRSLARTICEHLLDHALEEGVEQMQLVVTASNDFVIDFYRRLGFVPGETQYNAVKIDDEYYDWLTMRLSMERYEAEIRHQHDVEVEGGR